MLMIVCHECVSMLRFFSTNDPRETYRSMYNAQLSIFTIKECIKFLVHLLLHFRTSRGTYPNDDEKWTSICTLQFGSLRGSQQVCLNFWFISTAMRNRRTHTHTHYGNVSALHDLVEPISGMCGGDLWRAQWNVYSDGSCRITCKTFYIRHRSNLYSKLQVASTELTLLKCRLVELTSASEDQIETPGLTKEPETRFTTCRN